MSIRPFNPLTVIRMVPKELLEQCFQRLNLKDRELSYFCLNCSKQMLVRLFREHFQAQPRDHQDAIESALRLISDLASESGCAAMYDAAPHCGVWNLMLTMPYDLCVWGRAAWVWIHHPKVVERAQIIHQVDHQL